MLIIYLYDGISIFGFNVDCVILGRQQVSKKCVSYMEEALNYCIHYLGSRF
jgi:hypothetical protein